MPDARATEQLERGRVVFNTNWKVSASAHAPEPLSSGPLFNATSCNVCHNEGGHGQGPTGDGPVPPSLVIALGPRGSGDGAEPRGDPVYGRVFNPVALGAVLAEGVVTVRYRELGGTYYPGGTHWRVRDPEYHLENLHYGPLAATTVIKPRLAPPLFGLGLLEAVANSDIVGDPVDRRVGNGTTGEPAWHVRAGARLIGRFGWQGNSLSVRDQTTKALAFEMGVTSAERPADDCTQSQIRCVHTGGTPEASEESVAAVVAFVQSLAVPDASRRAADDDLGPRLFSAIGCDQCHRPKLPIELTDSAGGRTSRTISPYTDLRLHDLGTSMSDRDVSGRAVPTKWRTAPLWGIGYRMSTERFPTFLHDGRARSVEEAVLWHLGEATRAQRRFSELPPGRRAALLHWLETL